MKKTIKIGPIQRREENTTLIFAVRQRIKKMKTGEFFEVTGVDSKTANNLRASISYFSKKDSYRVSTRLTGEKLTIERVRK